MAGLLAAKALADYFAEVVVIERDAIDGAVGQRRGVPQAGHTHVMLGGGMRAFELLLPGFRDDIARAGAVLGDAGHDVCWYIEGGRLRRTRANIEGLGISRALLEAVVRERVRATPNIHLRDNCGVDGLVTGREKRRVTGVVCGTQEMAADLVVDASGRGSRSPKWLADFGYRPPPEDRVGIELRYTTRIFARQCKDDDGYNAVLIVPTPAGKRGGVIIKQEHSRWSVTLVTLFGDFPPADLAGFREFTRALPFPDIYDTICAAQPIGEPQTIRMPASVRRRYEYLRRFPAGYLVIGDAISSFNPVYGQGMSVAALEAVQLAAILRERRGNPARCFFRRAAKIIDAPWNTSTLNDLQMREATGPRSAATAALNWYVARVIRAGQYDAAPWRAFLNVSNLLAEPSSLMQPSVIARVIGQTIRLSALNVGLVTRRRT